MTLLMCHVGSSKSFHFPRMTVRSDKSFSVSYLSWWTDALHQQEICRIIGHDVAMIMIKLNDIMYNFLGLSATGMQSKEFLHVIV
jgi:hypothetical protein